MDANTLDLSSCHPMVDGSLHLQQDGTIAIADQAFADLIGIPATELAGRSWFSLFHPLDRHAVDAAVLQLNSQGHAHTTLRCVKTSGEIYQLYLHLRRSDQIAGDYSCMVMNLTSRIDLSADKLHYERLFCISNDLLCVASTMGYFLQVNPAFTRLLGYTEEELLQTSFLDFVHPDDVDNTLQELRKLRTGFDSTQFENRYRCKDGSWRWLAWSTPASDSEGILYAVAKDITDRKLFEDQLIRLAKFDHLSGLPNRGYLEDELKRAMARTSRNSHLLAGYFIDLDGFKDVNDHHGHDVGDDLLRNVAIRLRTQLRAGDFIARLGGDEFFVLAEFTMPGKAAHLAGKLEAAMQTPFALGEHLIQVNASVGVALYQPGSHEDAAAFIRQADKAMYICKHNHKHQQRHQHQHQQEQEKEQLHSSSEH